MKSCEHITPLAGLTTLSDIIGWRELLLQLHAKLSPHFARREPRARALRFVQGILSSLERKNGWQLAEQAREATPYGMQRLLSTAVWNENGVRDEIRAFVLHHLGTQEVILAVDETSFPKRGTHSAGVKKQYCGTTGQVQNCQVGVFVSYITARGHTLVDRELYVPLDWTADQARRQEVGIPEDLVFRSKPQLAIQMLERLHTASLPICWVVADSVYGSHHEWRSWLETHKLCYVGAVREDEPIVLHLRGIGVRRLEVREVTKRLKIAQDWHRYALSEGSKGPRLFDWMHLPIWHQGQDDGWHSLLIRRTLDPTPDLAYFLVFAPPGTSLLAKVEALAARWRIEEDFENGKELGLDHYEVRSFTGWYRHITLTMLALAFLTCISVLSAPPSDGLWPLSVPEARRLLSRLLFPLPASVPLVLAWSAWRRWHQRRASFFHLRRRLKAG